MSTTDRKDKQTAEAPDLHNSVTDLLHRFSFSDLPIRGQWVRLTEVVNEADRHHNYPLEVSQMMAQMYAAVAMFADNLKFSGAVALQSKGQGDLIRTLAECRQQSLLRGIAHFSEDFEHTKNQHLASPPTHLSKANAHNLAAWLGSPEEQVHLAISLIPASDTSLSGNLPAGQTYQGIVALNQPSIAANLEDYFTTSEQLPTKLYFAHPHTPGVTGLLLQKLPYPKNSSDEDLTRFEDAWHTLQTLASTTTEAELATLSAAGLLQRLFAEFPCRLHEPRSLSYQCTCNRDKTDRTLRVIEAAELRDLVEEQGVISIDCEFCGQSYSYDRVDVAELIEGRTSVPIPPNIH